MGRKKEDTKSTKPQEKSKPIKAVVYVASRNLYKHLKASIYSLLEHNQIDRVYLMIEDDVFPYALPKECITINISNQKTFLRGSANWSTPFSYLCLMRVAYTKYIQDIDKILQLDCDTIITGDISELWKVDMRGKYFAAVEEYKGTHKPFGDVYYNIGVAMFNLKKIRKDKADDALIDILNRQRLKYIDQDAWNLYGADKAVSLDVKYNECFVTGESDDTRIVHFAGVKEWWNTERVVKGWEAPCPKNHLYNLYGDFE